MAWLDVEAFDYCTCHYVCVLHQPSAIFWYRRKRPQKWRNQNLIIRHDNAPAHRSFKVSQFFAKNKMTVISLPPYSHDLAPCDFFQLFQLRMKGRRFDTIEEIQEESQRVLHTIPKWDFQGCFQAW